MSWAWGWSLSIAQTPDLGYGLASDQARSMLRSSPLLSSDWMRVKDDPATISFILNSSSWEWWYDEPDVISDELSLLQAHSLAITSWRDRGLSPTEVGVRGQTIGLSNAQAWLCPLSLHHHVISCCILRIHSWMRLMMVKSSWSNVPKYWNIPWVKILFYKILHLMWPWGFFYHYIEIIGGMRAWA